jgi:hypothetical protein
MLLGAWLLGQALHLEAGHVRGLLVLIAVLQLYEALLVGAGVWLVRSGRAPRDGASALVLESVFLCDAPLLAAECVTASLWVGTAAAIALAALAVVKLAWVRRSTPGLLDRVAAGVLGSHAAMGLALPAAAAHLASARLFGPAVLYGLWWSSLLLPIGRVVLRRHIAGAASPSRAVEAWTWAPAALVLLHLWAVGYIHALDVHPAFLAPLLLGFTLTSRREQLVRQVALPGLALLLSIGQGAALGAPTAGGALLATPLPVTLTAVIATWTYLAWRHRARWLAILAAASALAGIPGAIVQDLAGGATRLLRTIGTLVPRDAFGWGTLTVLAAFVFLAAAVRRSLGLGGRPGPRSRLPRGFFASPRDVAALALGLTTLFATASARTLAVRPLDHPRSREAAALTATAAALALVLAFRAHRRAAVVEEDAAGTRLATLAIVATLGAGTLAVSPLVAASPGHRIAHNEVLAVATLRSLVSAQLDTSAARTRLAGRGYSLVESRSVATGSVAWMAAPVEYGFTGTRAFCVDSTAVLRVAVDGRAAVPPGPDGLCDLTSWNALD